jgi:hypothetical protein
MPTYRMYYMNPFSGHIMHCREFEAPDDAAATKVCEEELSAGPIELWCDRRKVRRIDVHGHVSPFVPMPVV